MFFQKTKCNEGFIQRITHRLTTTTKTSDTATPSTTATTPYIKAYLRTSRASYNPSISASFTNPSLHYVSGWQTSTKKTNRGTDGGQFIRLIAPTVETSVTTTNNSPSQDCSHLEDQTTPFFKFFFYVLVSWFGNFSNRKATFPPVEKDFRYAW